jgi:hypothetical protein
VRAKDEGGKPSTWVIVLLFVALVGGVVFQVITELQTRKMGRGGQ